MEVLAKLGIDWKLLIAQAVNFLVLLWVLKRYAYGPILRALERRTQRIEDGLKHAAAADEKLRTVLDEEKKVMAAAREAAREVLSGAEAAAKKRDAAMLAETKAKIDKMITEADQALAEKQAKLIREAKVELVSVVALATEKVLAEKVDADKERTLVEKALQSVAQ
jgi:F-type H+-transporting ATPase subunit b